MPSHPEDAVARPTPAGDRRSRSERERHGRPDAAWRARCSEGTHHRATRWADLCSRSEAVPGFCVSSGCFLLEGIKRREAAGACELAKGWAPPAGKEGPAPRRKPRARRLSAAVAYFPWDAASPRPCLQSRQGAALRSSRVEAEVDRAGGSPLGTATQDIYLGLIANAGSSGPSRR